MRREKPYLYTKLEALARQYRELNEGYMQERNRVAKEVTHKFRINKDEMPIILEELSSMNGNRKRRLF